jgi:hypothetical protein
MAGLTGLLPVVPWRRYAVPGLGRPPMPSSTHSRRRPRERVSPVSPWRLAVDIGAEFKSRDARQTLNL